MNKYYITFGQDHTHRVPNHTLDKDCVAVIEAVDYMAARKKAFELFEAKWCFLYEEEKIDDKFMSYFPRGLINV